MSEPLKKRNELNLGLSLSGGGVRAVGFHLGTLDVLERLNLLKQVSMLSTVSGGSLVGIGYSLYLKMGAQCSPPKTFDTFFADFFEFLPKLDTMVELIDGMDVPSESGHRTMVGAMARIYREHYFQPCYGDPRFEVFWDPSLPEIHLKDMMFHASDFKTGLAFRFQYNDIVKNDPDQENIGNEQVFLSPEHAKELYMADIMTSSACLPGLLEPMFMPQDYRLSKSTKTAIRTHFADNCDVELDYVALMDGGMLDNQGISSILMALLRNSKGPLPPATRAPLPVSPWDYSIRWRSRYLSATPGHDTSSSDNGPEPGLLADIPTVSEPAPVGEAEVEQALEGLDLLIISDTPVYRPSKDRYFPKKPLFGSLSGFKALFMNRSLNFYFLVWLFLFIAGVGSLALVIWGLISVVLAAAPGTGFFRAIVDAIAASTFPGPLKIGLVAMVFVAIPVMLVHLGSWWLAWLLARRAEDQLDQLIPKREGSNRRALWHYVKSLKLAEAWLVIKLRLLSVIRLASEIFLNRVRQLSYRWVLAFKKLEHKVVPNEIFKLKVLDSTTGQNTMTPRGQFQLPGWMMTSSAQIDAIVEKASSMPTQIYLDDGPEPGVSAEQNLRILAACGNLTTCFNILEHLWQLHGNGDTSNQGDNAFPGDPHALSLFKETRTMWLQLQSDPFSYVNGRVPP
jgi:hypothetical protein